MCPFFHDMNNSTMRQSCGRILLGNNTGDGVVMLGVGSLYFNWTSFYTHTHIGKCHYRICLCRHRGEAEVYPQI